MEQTMMLVLGTVISVLVELYKYITVSKNEKIAGNTIRAIVFGVSLMVVTLLATNVVSRETLENIVIVIASAIGFYEFVIKMFYKSVEKVKGIKVSGKKKK